MNAPLRQQRWTDRDLPVLMSIVDATERDEDMPDDTTLPAAVGLDTADVLVAVRNLERGGYITGVTWAYGDGYTIGNITERALRETGVWPNAETDADRLLWLLERKVDEATTPEERGKWTKIRDAFGSAGRDFTIEVAAAMATRSIGG